MGGRNGRRRVIRDVYKGHMDKAKGGVGLRVGGGVSGGKWKQLYLNNNKKC